MMMTLREESRWMYQVNQDQTRPRLCAQVPVTQFQVIPNPYDVDPQFVEAQHQRYQQFQPPKQGVSASYADVPTWRTEGPAGPPRPDSTPLPLNVSQISMDPSFTELLRMDSQDQRDALNTPPPPAPEN